MSLMRSWVKGGNVGGLPAANGRSGGWLPPKACLWHFYNRKETMMIQLRNLISVGMLAATLALGACSAAPMASSTVAVSAKLAGSTEVPANASTGSGSLAATFDKSTNVLSWTVSYAGLSGPVKAGHFHGPAMAGQNAGVALGFSGSMDSPIKGSATLTAAQAADLLAGKWYVNLHTAANPGGEVRGQATVAP